MNLSARVSKLEASSDNSATITIFSDGKTPEQISAEIAARTGTATTKPRVLLIGLSAAIGLRCRVGEKGLIGQSATTAA